MIPASAATLDSGAAGMKDEQRFSLREAARILEVPEARLRSLARAGLLAPQRGPLGPLSFGFRDLLLLRSTKGLLEAGVSMRRIRRIWSSLRDQLAADTPLTSITIRADGDLIVASDGRTAWQPDSGQFLLDFDAAEIVERSRSVGVPAPGTTRRATGSVGPAPSGVEGYGDAALAPTPAPMSEAEMNAEQWYERALDLEGTTPLEAIAAYQQVLERDPGMTDAHVNLGRLYHLAGERGRAEAQYRDAVRLAPDDPTPHFNLGVLLEEQGRRDEATHAYAQAVARDPEFADAHCNLGLLLESMGRRQEAMGHLMTARELYRSEE